jgi:hypothetical protein
MVRNSLDFAFADEATKTRLKSELAAAFNAFERRTKDQGPRTKDW